jgi:hypothetical protein
VQSERNAKANQFVTRCTVDRHSSRAFPIPIAAIDTSGLSGSAQWKQPVPDLEVGVVEEKVRNRN